jgi:hypothetical protein
MNSRPIRCALAVFALVTTGCGNDTTHTSAATSARAEVSDSAGIVSIQYEDLARAAVTLLATTEEYSTADAGIDMYRPVAARLLPDGGVLIANAGSHEIVHLDGSGQLARRFGREGDGPGEFRGLSALFVTDSMTVVAYDARHARLAEFDLEGTALGTRALAPASRVVDLQPLALLPDGGVVAVLGEIRVFGRSGIGRDSTPLMRFDASGTAPDTIGYWKVTEYSFAALPGGGSSRRAVGFGRDAAWAGRDGRAVIGSTDTIDLTVIDEGEIAARIRSAGTAEPVSEDALRHWRADLARSASRAPADFQQTILDTPARETYPAFDALAMDDEGRVWIGLYPVPGQATRRWIIVARDGTVPGAIELPSNARILDAAMGRITVLLRSELDEEFVAVMRVR